jgi:hypothetical protein
MPIVYISQNFSEILANVIGREKTLLFAGEMIVYIKFRGIH